ncbi:hypothetical protein RGQ29_030419 [Quercus rubra]|uniref:CCHC-type domain-containing protein n=1 Tax=Quercus rubra TaxID=3512 RepID=A0AAN7IAM8_QUERU|nr:hypothetical protein RGQ29_030419 [Quercus rubra]KAK4572009.1 hypothetical protein RGQ29_030419 [Quercus rubra]
MNKTIKCGKCKKEGHNARGCKAGITGETPWQRRDKLAKSKAAQGNKSTKTKQTTTPQTASQPPSTRSQPAYRAFGQTASQPAPNNRSEAATQPPTRFRANWFSSSSQLSFHTPKET